MASIVNNRGKKKILDAFWVGGTFKVLLLAGTYNPNPDHNFVSDVSGHELSGTGYTPGFAGSGRKTLAGMASTQDDAANVAIATATDTVYALINAGTAAYAVIYMPVTNDADSPIVATLYMGSVLTIGANLTVDWPDAAVGGIFFI